VRNDLEELKARIIATLDVTDFLDIIGWELPDLLEVLEEQLEEHYDSLSNATR
jgi:hypothetical protein